MEVAGHRGHPWEGVARLHQLALKKSQRPPAGKQTHVLLQSLQMITHKHKPSSASLGRGKKQRKESPANPLQKLDNEYTHRPSSQRKCMTLTAAGSLAHMDSCPGLSSGLGPVRERPREGGGSQSSISCLASVHLILPISVASVACPLNASSD